jgi:hypothetical protein
MINKKEAEKFCGNCDSHNLYEFPSKIFCSTRYDQGKDPIVDTLWHCEDWSLVSQKCYCVREALSEKNGH